MLQKVLKFANYAVEVLVEKIMLFCFNYTKNYACTIRQGLGVRTETRLRELTDAELNCTHFFVNDLFSCSSSVRLLCEPNSFSCLHKKLCGIA